MQKAVFEVPAIKKKKKKLLDYILGTQGQKKGGKSQSN